MAVSRSGAHGVGVKVRCDGRTRLTDVWAPFKSPKCEGNPVALQIFGGRGKEPTEASRLPGTGCQRRGEFAALSQLLVDRLSAAGCLAWNTGGGGPRDLAPGTRSLGYF